MSEHKKRDKADALHGVKSSKRAVEDWSRDLQLAVEIAKGKGATWKEIGEALGGITAQAAQQRFGGK